MQYRSSWHLMSLMTMEEVIYKLECRSIHDAIIEWTEHAASYLLIQNTSAGHKRRPSPNTILIILPLAEYQTQRDTFWLDEGTTASLPELDNLKKGLANSVGIVGFRVPDVRASVFWRWLGSEYSAVSLNGHFYNFIKQFHIRETVNKSQSLRRMFNMKFKIDICWYTWRKWVQGPSRGPKIIHR